MQIGNLKSVSSGIDCSPDQVAPSSGHEQPVPGHLPDRGSAIRRHLKKAITKCARENSKNPTG